MKIVLATLVICAIHASQDDRLSDDSSQRSAPYQYKMDSTTKNAIIAGFAKAGAAAAWFYGDTILYDTCHYLAEFSAPSSGFRYFAIGHQAYHHAGKACEDSQSARAALSAMCGTLSGTLGYFSIKTIEKTVTILGKLCGK